MRIVKLVHRLSGGIQYAFNDVPCIIKECDIPIVDLAVFVVFLTENSNNCAPTMNDK